MPLPSFILMESHKKDCKLVRGIMVSIAFFFFLLRRFGLVLLPPNESWTLSPVGADRAMRST